jgi:hypothetical protein
MALDPRSDKVALYYAGDEEGNPSLVNVPARDLTEADLARLLYVENVDRADDETRVTEAALTKRLLDGPYRKTKPDRPARNAAPAVAPDEKPED